MRRINYKILNFSIFYVFYEQYLTIWDDAIFSLGLSLAAIFIVTLLVTGLDIISSTLVLFMVTLILFDMLGIMWLWNITLNAVSLVNLVVVRYKSLNVHYYILKKTISFNFRALALVSNLFHILYELILDVKVQNWSVLENLLFQQEAVYYLELH